MFLVQMADLASSGDLVYKMRSDPVVLGGLLSLMKVGGVASVFHSSNKHDISSSFNLSRCSKFSVAVENGSSYSLRSVSEPDN